MIYCNHGVLLETVHYIFYPCPDHFKGSSSELKDKISSYLHYSFEFVPICIKAFFDSRIIRRMMCESVVSTNAKIAPMHCCLGEPDCLAGVMFLFHTNWHITCRHGRGLLFQFSLFSVHVSACITSWLCLFPISTSSHDESLAAAIRMIATTVE